MSLTTFSTFYYGHEITSDNNLFDFSENGGPINTAELDVGKYSLTEFLVKVRDALNAAGNYIYVVTVDRNTREITIHSDDGDFELLVQTGPSVGQSAYPLIGFLGSDRTGSDTYTGNAGSGSEYSPQFILQDYVPKENFKRNSGAVNETASGLVEVVTFGNVRFTQFDITMITNLKMDGRVIKNNANGVADANSFMNYITKVAPIEFMPNTADRATYQKVQLESTLQSKDGIDYMLKELYDRGLPGFYKTGLLVFRVID